MRLWTFLALPLVGLLLPYAVAIGATAWFGDRDDETSQLTLGAYVLGLACCSPLARRLLADRYRIEQAAFVCAFLLAAAIQLIAVFVVQSWYYLETGGRFP